MHAFAHYLLLLSNYNFKMALATQHGLWFEDYEVGLAGVSVARTVTEADIVAFAGLSGDFNDIHIDAEAAKKSAFGQRVAHGLLGLSIASGLVVQMGFMKGTVDAFRGLGVGIHRPRLYRRHYPRRDGSD